MRAPSVIRKDRRGVSPVIATILLVGITVVLAAVLYVLSLGLVSNTSMSPMIGVTKTLNDKDYIWTVDAITGGSPIYKSNVYIQLQNESGFVIHTEPLFSAGNATGCNGSHGFLYVSATSNSTYIGVGDVFHLDRAYAQGCTINLVNPTASSIYAMLTV